MHRPADGGSHDPRRGGAPLGAAAVVYRGGGQPPQQRGRSGVMSGENTYFILDADAVVDEPPPHLVDPMSLPRTHDRNRTGPHGSYPTDGRFDTAEPFVPLEPLVTADGKIVEDVILNPVAHPGTNGRFFVAADAAANSLAAPQDRPLFLGKGSEYPGGSEENWPPPPPAELGAREDVTQLSSSPARREGHQNNSLQIALRPAREGQGTQRSVGSGADVDASAENGRIASM